MKFSFDDLGINTRKVVKRVTADMNKKDESLFRRRGRSRFREITATTFQTNENKSGLDFQEIARLQSRSRGPSRNTSRTRSKSRNRSKSRTHSKGPSKGISSIRASQTAQKLKRKAIAALNRKGRTHESDRRIYNNKPLHLFKGKNRPKGR